MGSSFMNDVAPLRSEGEIDDNSDYLIVVIEFGKDGKTPCGGGRSAHNGGGPLGRDVYLAERASSRAAAPCDHTYGPVTLQPKRTLIKVAGVENHKLAAVHGNTANSFSLHHLVLSGWGKGSLGFGDPRLRPQERLWVERARIWRSSRTSATSFDVSPLYQR